MLQIFPLLYWNTEPQIGTNCLTLSTMEDGIRHASGPVHTKQHNRYIYLLHILIGAPWKEGMVILEVDKVHWSSTQELGVTVKNRPCIQ